MTGYVLGYILGYIFLSFLNMLLGFQATQLSVSDETD